MNTKTANLIAVELGILIAIMAWLAFSNRPGVKAQPMTKAPERTAGSFATVRPVLQSTNQPREVVDYRADDSEAQPVDEEPAPTVQQYDQEIAPEPSYRSELNDGFIAESSPSYVVVAPQPVVYSSDYLVSSLDQIVFCPQPNEIIVFSNVRSSGRRHHPPPRTGGGRVMATPRRPVGGEPPHIRGNGGVVPRRNTNTRPSRQIPGPPRSLARR